MGANRRYVLVVDDNIDAADSLADLVTLWGYYAEARYDGAAALAAARVRRPSVALVDVGMPVMSGFEFVRRLRCLPECERTAVVVVTGHTAEAYRSIGRDLGIDGYLVKPVEPVLLREGLRRLTAGLEAPTPPDGLGSREAGLPLEPALADYPGRRRARPA